MSRSEAKLFKDALEADLVQSTLDWLDFIDCENPNYADEEDVLLGLQEYDPYGNNMGKELLKYVENMPHKQFKKLMARVLDKVVKECYKDFDDEDTEWG
jgi:hypothetical protein